jgi:hypothetical protein
LTSFDCESEYTCILTKSGNEYGYFESDDVVQYLKQFRDCAIIIGGGRRGEGEGGREKEGGGWVVK